jgi:signal transduction histidine kinase
VPWRGIGAIDVGLTALLVALSAFTVLVVAVPNVQPAIVNDRLDLAITTAAALVGLSVAGLASIRYRESGELRSLLQASAFTMLGTYNLVTLVVAVGGWEASVQSSLRDPGQLPILAGIVARLITAILLVASALAGLRRTRPSAARVRLVTWGPTLAVFGLFALLVVLDAPLPSIVDPAAIDRLRADPYQPLGPNAGPLLLATQLAVALGYLAAGWLSYRDWRGTGRIGDASLAAGLMIAAFSQVHAGIHPGAFAGLVTSADLLRIGFYLALLLGLSAERRADIRALRTANVELQRLREADAERAALEERARIAREIHDGLAQDLWYAKLKQTRLLQAGPLSDEQLTLVGEVADAIDAALTEARQSVLALRVADDAPLDGLIERFVEDYADRFGIRVTLARGTALPTLPVKARAEVLRIVQEALNNVRKHADATTVRIRLDAVDGGLRVSIVDNGRGFDPRTGDGGGFGMESMRQRAALIGGSIEVEARPQDGTRLALTVMVNPTETIA